MTILVRVMSLLTACGPAAIRKKGLKILFRTTAAAFGSPPPVSAGRSFNESLPEYARFTHREAQKLNASGIDPGSVRERLFQGGEDLGKRLRKTFRIRRAEEAVSAMKALYRAIDIRTVPGEPDGITVSRCYFSTTYTAETCEVISALDDGVFAGLSGGGRLKFCCRLTEGATCCRCEITPSRR